LELKGRLESLPLADLLKLVETKEHTGRLVLSGEGGESVLYFKGGCLVFTGGLLDPLRIGHRLAALGALSRKTLLSWTLAVRRGEKDNLLDFYPCPEISDELWRRAFEIELADFSLELFDRKTGEFEFEGGAIDLPKSLSLDLPVSPFIEQARARLEGWARLQKALPQGGEIPAPARFDESKSLEAPLSAELWRVLTRVDGRRTPRALAASAGLSRVDAYQALHELTRRGLVEWIAREKPAARARKAAAPEPQAEQRGGLFGLLGSKEKSVEALHFDSPIALVTEFENRLLDQLDVEAEGKKDSGGLLQSFWEEASERHALSDLVKVQSGRLNAESCERELSRWQDPDAVEECLIDSLSLLRRIVEATHETLTGLLGEKKALAVYRKEYEQLFRPESIRNMLEPLSWLSLAK